MPILDVARGGTHTCALLKGGYVRCPERAPIRRQELPVQVRAEMDVWHNQMFGGASPLAAEASNYFIVLAAGDEDDDVVTYELNVGEKAAKLYETKGQLGVFFPLQEDQASDAEHLHRMLVGLSRLCISGEFVWELRSRTEIEGPVAFSTNPRQSNLPCPVMELSFGRRGDRWSPVLTLVQA